MTDTNTMRARIAAELHDRTDLDAEILKEIVSAIRHYQSKQFEFNTFTDDEWGVTADGTRTYAYLPRHQALDTVKLKYTGDYVPLYKRTWREIDELDRDVTGSTGLPSRYAIKNKVVRLYPIPNGAYTIVSSGTLRYPTISRTGSFCASASITPTTTASHNNRANGWFVEAEELIRARAKAAVRIHYIHDDTAIQEHALMAQRGTSFLSMLEEAAYKTLATEAWDTIAARRIKPHMI